MKKNQPLQPEERFDPEKIAMVDFRLAKGNVEVPDSFDPATITEFDVSPQLGLAFNLPENMVRCEISIAIRTLHKSKKKEIEPAQGYYQLVFFYSVENLASLAKLDKEGMVDVRPDLATALAAITYSTVRGVLLTRLQGTALQRFVLPVIDPAMLLKPDH